MGGISEFRRGGGGGYVDWNSEDTGGSLDWDSEGIILQHMWTVEENVFFSKCFINHKVL